VLFRSWPSARRRTSESRRRTGTTRRVVGLRPEIVERAIEFAIDELRPDSDDSRRADILAEIYRLDSELARLTAAIASGGDLPALLAAVKEKQDRRERCERMLIELDAMSRIGRSELSCLEREIRHRLADWRAMLRREVPERANSSGT
jgi:hypothetical protein